MPVTREARGGTLVVGGGYGGSWVARRLGSRGATIVSRDNFMLFTPMLPEAASGTLEPRHAVVPLRLMCPHADLVLGHAVGLDEERSTVTVESEVGVYEIVYRNLVIALGAVPRTFPIPGLVEHAVGFKTLADAVHLRNHVLRELEIADAEPDPERIAAHLGYVFVGGGYAGVEALAELNDLVRDAMRYYPRLRAVRQRWVLVDAAPRILSEVPTRLGEYAARQLERRGVEIRHNTRLQSAEQDLVVLSDGERVAARTLVWTAGVRANPLLGKLGLPLDGQGRVLVDEYLRVQDQNGPLGARRLRSRSQPGDTRPLGSTHLPACAATGAAACTEYRRLRKGASLDPYHYRMMGQAATLGRRKGIADVLGIRLSGFPGWFFTRTYHLYTVAARFSQAQSRRRLDNGSLLPARHRRARDARPPRVAPPER